MSVSRPSLFSGASAPVQSRRILLGSGRDLSVVFRPLASAGLVVNTYSGFPVWGGVDRTHHSLPVVAACLEERFHSMLERPVRSASKEKAQALVEDPWIFDHYPLVFEWLSAETWGDGSKKERSTCTFFFEDGQVKLCLSNKDDQVSLWASGDTLEAALGVLNARLADPKAEWRPMGGKGRGSRR
jgi:hypothetical protein